MAIAIGLNPAWATGTAVGLPSVAFSPVAGSLILVEAHLDSTVASIAPTISDSIGLTWTAIGTPQRGSSGGFSMAWWTITNNAQTNMTVTVSWAGSGAQKSIKPTTYTGAGSVITKTQGASGTNNLTVNVTNTNNGCLIAGTALDWNARGVPVSTDDELGYTITNFISGVSVRKAANTNGTGVNVSLNFDGGGTQATIWAYKIYEIVPSASGPITVMVNQITETDTSNAIGKRKLKSVSQIAETDTSQPFSRHKVKGVLQVSEADIAQPINRTTPIRLVNTVTEADIAQPITVRKVKLIGFPVESDTPQPIRPIHKRTIGQVIENDTVTPIGKRKLRTVGQSVETDSAQTIKIQGKVFQVIETDIAQPIRSIKRKTIGQPTETSTALTITPRRLLLVTVNAVVEVDSPTTLRTIKRITLGIADETDLARVITPRTELAPLPDGIITSVVIEPITIDVVITQGSNVIPKAYNANVSISGYVITVIL